MISQVSDAVKPINPLRTSFLFTFTSWTVISALTTPITVNSTPIFSSFLALPSRLCLKKVERFSYDIEMKTREQNRNNKLTEIERFDWYRRDTNACGFWLVKWTLGGKNFMPENFLEINRYFGLTSYWNTMGQSNNAFSILGFSLAGKRRGHVLIFSSLHPLADKTNNEHLPKAFFKVIRKSL